MNSFLAIVYICATATPTSECNETSARDVLQVRVHSEMGCMMGWQEVVARSAFAEGVGTDSYLKTRCRRLPVPEGAEPPR